jgi:hypothetical protein
VALSQDNTRKSMQPKPPERRSAAAGKPAPQRRRDSRDHKGRHLGGRVTSFVARRDWINRPENFIKISSLAKSFGPRHFVGTKIQHFLFALS